MNKRMRQALEARAFFPALCYGVTLAAWLLAGAVFFGSVLAAQWTGRLPRQTFGAAELELQNLILTEEGVLGCTTPDPQLIWHNTDGIAVVSAEMTAQYDGFAGEICLYYKRTEAEEFSQSNRVFAVKTGGNTYSFTLPRGRVAALRLDVCSDLCAVSGFSLTLNAPRSFFSYFTPTWRQVYAFLLYPGLAACALALAAELWREYGPDGGTRYLKRRA